MIYGNENGLPHYRFSNLAGFPELFHGILTRNGGVSRKPFDSLNVGFGLGDDDDNVQRNRQLIRKIAGNSNLIFARQNHGTTVLVFSGGLSGTRPPDAGNPLTGDAMVTNLPGCGLVIQVADCQAILLYDPVRRVVANIHSGWRGSIRNIAGRTVAVMASEFGSRADDLVAGVGPSLGPCCAEFVHYRREIPESLWRYRHEGDRFDFWQMTHDQLVDAGVRSEKIAVSGLCTRCNADRFFSYRAENKTGRFAAVIGLEPATVGTNRVV